METVLAWYHYNYCHHHVQSMLTSAVIDSVSFSLHDKPGKVSFLFLNVVCLFKLSFCMIHLAKCWMTLCLLPCTFLLFWYIFTKCPQHFGCPFLMCFIIFSVLVYLSFFSDDVVNTNPNDDYLDVMTNLSAILEMAFKWNSWVILIG